MCDWKYEDTLEDAIRYLKETTDLNVVGAFGIMDPVVDGCWLVHLPEGEGKESPCSVLVWLFGTPMSPANMSDFEVFEYQPDAKPNWP